MLYQNYMKIILDMYIKNYQYRCDTNAFKTLKARILACKNIVKLYGMIHDSGFCFQHPCGKVNFNIDYQTGKVELICVDEILTLGKYYGIGRNSLETAPELFGNYEPSSIESDRYSLAVLLFEILFDGHPFSGKKTIGSLTSEAQRLWFVDSPYMYGTTEMILIVHLIFKIID